MTRVVTTDQVPSMKAMLWWSVGLHAFLLATMIVAGLRSTGGESWGGLGGSVQVGLVRSVGIPLPRPDVVTTSRVVDESRGLYKSEPKPKERETPAPKIPEFAKNKRQKYVSRPSRVLEDETPPPQGAIPYGQGGTPAMPYTQFVVAGHTEGGMKIGEGGGGGEFGSQYPWYVEAVRRRISSNWLVSTIDPSLSWAPRAVVTFQILPSGTITNVQLMRSSGNSSVDNSARRAILDSGPLERLPAGYRGSSVNVEFWFDFRR